jgi:hypothetical protein
MRPSSPRSILRRREGTGFGDEDFDAGKQRQSNSVLWALGLAPSRWSIPNRDCQSGVEKVKYDLLVLLIPIGYLLWVIFTVTGDDEN